MKHGLTIGVLLALALGTVSALPYSASSPVVDLTPSNFETKIKASGLMLVEVGLNIDEPEGLERTT